MADESTSGPFDKIKDFYYKIEDKWYDFLDKINQYVPVYEIIDPIDRIVPSLLLFFGLSVLVTGLAFYFFNFAGFGFTAALKVVDSDGNPVEGANVKIFFNDTQHDLTTDSFGFVSVSIPESEIEADVSVEKENFPMFNRLLLLSANNVQEITLTSGAFMLSDVCGSDGCTVRVVENGRNWPGETSVTLTFTCSSGESPSPLTRADGIFNFSVSNCSDLSVTASASGFDSASKKITRKETFINLSKNVENLTGSLYVKVVDSQNLPVQSADITVSDSVTGTPFQETQSTQSGDKLFENVPPGSYIVTASTDAGAFGESEGVQVNAGLRTDITVTIEKGKRVFFEVIDSESKQNIASNVRLFKNTVFLKSFSALKGSKAFAVGNIQNEDIIAVVSAEDYFLKVQKLPVFDTIPENPEQIEIEKVDKVNQNYGLADVTVFSESGETASNALVFLHEASFGVVISNPLGELTLEDGTYSFSDVFLPQGDYFVNAKKGNEEGVSDDKEISAGETESFEIRMEKGTGFIEALIVDHKTAEPVSGATVTFFESETDTEKDSCTTDSKGLCTSIDLKAGENFYVKASASEYISSYSNTLVTVLKKNTQKITIELWAEKDLDDLPDSDLLSWFEYLCFDSDCQRQVPIIESLNQDQKVFAKFLLIMQKDSVYTDLIQHIRVGLESQNKIPNSGYKIALKNVQSALSDDISLSNCFNSSDQFFTSDEQGCKNTTPGENSKSSLINFNLISGPVIVPIIAELEIEKNATEKLQLRHAAVTSVSGNTLFDPSTGTHLEVFEMGKVLCFPSSKDLLWQFSINPGKELPQNSDKNPNILLTGSRNISSVAVKQPYQIGYSAFNCSEQDFSNASLKTEENASSVSSKIFSIWLNPPENVPTGKFTVFNNETINHENFHSGIFNIKGSEEKDNVELKFDFDSGNSVNDRFSIFFKTLSSEELIVNGLPETVEPVNQPLISGTITDEQSEPVEGATIALFALDSTQITGNHESNDAGEFTIPENELTNLGAYGQQILFRATKSGFRTYNETLDVQSSSSENTLFSCLTYDKETVSVERQGSENFIIFSSCSQEIFLSIGSDLVTSPDVGEEFSLNNAESKTVTVSSDLQPNTLATTGLFPVKIFGRFAQNETPVLAKDIEAFVTDPNNCFSMDSYRINLELGEKRETGFFTNKCFTDSDEPAEASTSEPSKISITDLTPEIDTEESLFFDTTVKMIVVLKDDSVDEDTENYPQQGLFRGQTRELAPFDAFKQFDDYLTQNNLQSSDVKSVSFTAQASEQNIVVWLENRSLIGSYPFDESRNTQVYNFTMTNEDVRATSYFYSIFTDTVSDSG